jgi:hypothetical protein
VHGPDGLRREIAECGYVRGRSRAQSRSALNGFVLQRVKVASKVQRRCDCCEPTFPMVRPANKRIGSGRTTKIVALGHEPNGQFETGLKDAGPQLGQIWATDGPQRKTPTFWAGAKSVLTYCFC